MQLIAPNRGTQGFTSVSGRCQDRPTPSALLWDQRATAGDCRLLVPRVPFCSPSCGSSGVCVMDGRCEPHAVARPVGAVRVTGVRTSAGMAPWELTLVSGSYQTPGALTLPYPAFAEGDTLRIDAAGAGGVAPFSVETRGIVPLALTSTDLRVEMNRALDLTWTAAGVAGSRVKVKLDISHHGGTRGMITCDTDDDGALTLAPELLTQLLALGVAGFPTVVVTRSRAGTTTVGAGSVELVVSSELETEVTIPGLRSCTSDADCMGGTCRPDLTCT
ncbi:MAG: hypothetical protein HY909_31005 [Deltaproteobacteria bacterium]|nr:hypothetical protein [Deltaproteobacteria bacterium]